MNARGVMGVYVVSILCLLSMPYAESSQKIIPEKHDYLAVKIVSWISRTLPVTFFIFHNLYVYIHET